MGRVLLFQGLVGLTEAMYLWLVAAGLSLIFGVLRVLNFAHGALYMIGAYLTYAVFRAFGGNFWIALLVGPVLVALIGWVMEVVFLRHLPRGRGLPTPPHLRVRAHPRRHREARLRPRLP